MNRKLTLTAVTLGLASLTACNAVEIATYTDQVVGVDVRPVEKDALADPGDAVTPCEGAFQRDADGNVIVEGADNVPIPCPVPEPPPATLQPGAICEEGNHQIVDGEIVVEGAASVPLPCP